MANYVFNSVRFIGDPAKVVEVHELFLDIEAKQVATGQYHLPDFVDADRGHMLEIVVNDDWLNYETRWIPNLEVLAQIALRYQLDFIARYEEPTNFIYGEAVFTGCELHQVTLTSFDGEDWYNDREFISLQDLQASLLAGQQLKR